MRSNFTAYINTQTLEYPVVGRHYNFYDSTPLLPYGLNGLNTIAVFLEDSSVVPVGWALPTDNF
ncbi:MULTISPECIES: hypothetical protein [unclassified Chamaesiphon]|uniref:hypothetical protein n=1 Tax=unclassified Chamaesiphon TaxID=2620921 RepID=UPI00286CB1B8|nr:MULTISPECIES: hypothetical protein [unclassified Chamaesiphon]